MPDYPGGYKTVKEQIRERRQRPLLLDLIRKERAKTADPKHIPSWTPVPLMDWIPQVTPDFAPPKHLGPLVEVLERAHREPLEFAFSCPPRHFKTQSIAHAIAWWWKQDPTLPIAYITYGHDRAVSVGKEVKRVVKRAGIKLGGRQREDDWETAYGGRLKLGGVRGQLTGEGFRVIIVDDPHKNREEAESGVIRRRVVDAFWSDVYTRRHPKGTAFLVVHTRWHPDDLIGNLTEAPDPKREPFGYVNLPAITDNGSPLAPDFYGLDELQQIQSSIGEYAWASLYMGHPRPRGQELFGEPETCTLADIPAGGRDGIGVDLAYTAKTQADYSVALVLRKVVDHSKHFPADYYYVTDVRRKQVQAPDFAVELHQLGVKHPGAPMWWYCAGTEKGSANFLQRQGIGLVTKNAGADKFVRAQGVAAAWNDGRVIVPKDAPWASALLAEVTAFTGVNDPHDDIVDALAAAYDSLSSSVPAGERIQSYGRRVGREAHTHF